MVSRKQKKHLKKIKNLEKRVDVNDLCPLIYRCSEPWCYDKLGSYRRCERYINNNPRVDSNDPNYHVDGWKDNP